MAEDPHYKKAISFSQFGRTWTFQVSQDLFSSYDIDVGTKFLLRTISDHSDSPIGAVLDLGCGYGPIGLTLKELYRDAVVHLVDRDALAIAYSRRNAEINNVSGVEIYGSLGYDDLRRRAYGLIVSNIPAKAGEAAIRYFLRDAGYHLEPGGLVAFVVVSRLKVLIEQILGTTPHVTVVRQQDRAGHTVFQ